MNFDSLSSKTNKQIVSGLFPSRKLEPAEPHYLHQIDIGDKATQGMKLLLNEQLYSGSLLYFRIKKAQIVAAGRKDIFKGDINVLININVDPDYLCVETKSFQKALKLVPSVTDLDETLLYGAICYKNALVLQNHDEKQECESMLFALILLLREAMEKEQKYQKTINLDNIGEHNLAEIILSDWSALDTSFFAELTSIERKAFGEYCNKRAEITELYNSDKLYSEEIAKDSEDEWLTFLAILNDLSNKEYETIAEINAGNSQNEKIRAINDYELVINEIKRDTYLLEEKEVSLCPIFDKVIERLQYSPNNCVVKTENEAPFILHAVAPYLIMRPQTFNYLLMKYNNFRMNPYKQTADDFFSLALHSIINNLGIGEEKKCNSIDEKIAEFCKCVTTFVENNRQDIEALNFSSVQEGVVSIPGVTADYFINENLENQFEGMIRKMVKDAGVDGWIENSLTQTEEEAQQEIKEAEQIAELQEKMGFAQLIVASLDIIYIFCDALRIVLNNKHVNKKIKDIDCIKRYRRELQTIEAKLGVRVYSRIDDSMMSLQEYREHKGVIATSFTEREFQIEKYRNDMFAEAFKEGINKLLVGIDDCDVEQLLERKTALVEEIQRLPDCQEKNHFASFVDEISDVICKHLVDVCKSAHNEFDDIKVKLTSKVGAAIKLLPDEVINSLTTAELLYTIYANDEYCQKGFDYSGISALYYQAFETAYNQLIWKKYADMLNALQINGILYTDYVEENRNREIKEEEFSGYLSNKSFDRGFYINYKTKKNKRERTEVVEHCMYSSFGIIMKNISPEGELDKYCDFFASLAGFKNKEDMFLNEEFVNNCKIFSETVIESAENRNNASHGPSQISMEQCTEDKKTVLNNIKEIRESNLGLILQLIQLLSCN